MPYHSLTYSLTNLPTYSPQRKLEHMGGGLMETAQNATPNPNPNPNPNRNPNRNPSPNPNPTPNPNQDSKSMYDEFCAKVSGAV